MKRKVLIIDDLELVKSVLKRICEKLGLEAITAGSAEEGIALYQTASPQIVTMDITLPDMNGIEAVKKIKSLDPSARIIMITGADDRDKLAESLKAGACDYIVKPFDSERVVRSFLNQMKNKL
ncbi:MAG: response regulator [Candidatus Wallbacteria bacterium]|nr:response regulator [Candidatus Wallbacteria bacterium]